MIELHTSADARAEMREQAVDMIQNKNTSISGLLLCGMIISLLDDIDTLLEEINEP